LLLKHPFPLVILLPDPLQLKGVISFHHKYDGTPRRSVPTS
jgi:hypothetical protein